MRRFQHRFASLLVKKFALFAAVLLAVGAAAAELESNDVLRALIEEQEETFLKVDEAFLFSSELREGTLIARWDMVDGYYLYRHRFGATVTEGDASVGELVIPDGKPKVDEWQGEVEVYYGSAAIEVPLSGSGTATVSVGYQGCADAGLCYPPETKTVYVDLDSGSILSAAPAVGTSEPAAGASASAAPGASSGAPVTEEQALAAQLADSSLLVALALFFIGGVALAFTPCVLPMVPILSSIIVGESQGGDLSRVRAFTLSLAYVLGMAVTYAIIGTLVGLFGAELNIQAQLQSPPVLIVFAIIFVLLSLSMFGFYELQLPSGLQNRLNALSSSVGGGKHLSVAIMGSVSSLVVSPCVSAPLAGALIYISSTGDAVLGGGALFVLALGMGLPLLLIGASGGHLLPKAGAWMDNVKAVFGVLLLGVAIWLLERVIPASATLALWAALAIGSAVYLGALDFNERNGWGQLWKSTGVVMLVYGVLLLIGAASGANDPLRPLGQLAGGGNAGGGAGHVEANWMPVSNLPDVERQLGGEPAILDLYADWCISCKIMERDVFPAAGVAERLAQFRLLRADVTDNNAEHKAMLDSYGLFGPPSLLFFDRTGRELVDLRIQGEMDREQFEAHLALVQSRLAGGLQAAR